MRVYPLASSSKGNAYVVTDGGEALLIDCGLPYRTMATKLADVPEWSELSLSGVLITHNHTDHIAGLKTFLGHYDVPVFANAMTAEATAAELGLGIDRFIEFENGEDFEVGGFTVHPFSIPHDTPDPVGYLVTGSKCYFHATDVGTPLEAIGLQLAQADLATLESNHDLEMLLKSGRAPSLIQRIRGPRGHLSNGDACELVRRFASPKLKRLTLAHLSHDCNTPSLAELEMRETLADMHRTDIELEVAL